MKKLSWSALDESLSWRYAVPVVLENVFLTGIGMLFSAMVSHISASALSAINFGNQVMTVIFTAFSILTTGAAALVSRHIGARDNAAAADTAEQALLISVVGSVALMILYELFNEPLMRLLTPSADPQLFREITRFNRIQMYSLPFHVLHGTTSSICRATGNSRSPLVVSILMNVFLVLMTLLFLNGFGMAEDGAAWAYVASRLLGAVLMCWLTLKEHSLALIRIRRALRPHGETIRAIVRIGLPISIEFILVQVGYLLANSMAVALGTLQVGTYSVLNTLNGYSTIISNSTSVIAIAAVGHLIGARRDEDARKAGMIVWAVGMAVTLLCNITLMLGVRSFASLYSSDPATVELCVRTAWVICVSDFAATTLNSLDPQLRTGGDVKYVMCVTLSCVWLVRLPLTWLFCFRLNLGAMGIFLANTISLYARCVGSMIRRFGHRWIHHNV